MNNTQRIIQTNEEFKIFADTYRMRIIDMYIEKDMPMTVKMVADFLKEVPAKVHYHVKKLVKINILILDHIEVINGINAKYYVLKDSTFKIAIKDDTSPKMKEFQVDATMGIIIKSIDNFRNDVIARAEEVKKQEKSDTREGFIIQRKIHLTDTELVELRNMIFDYINNHSKTDEGKTKYSILAGIFQKTE
ncbi:MAG: helix-turn-helix transcriptional regulator [Tenericutes bacterium]|nr:helix-turn-helix transcriptional regulator [Mycoplasmatota bacterium]